MIELQSKSNYFRNIHRINRLMCLIEVFDHKQIKCLIKVFHSICAAFHNDLSMYGTIKHQSVNERA